MKNLEEVKPGDLEKWTYTGQTNAQEIEYSRICHLILMYDGGPS
jgi:hypothetical protein